MAARALGLSPVVWIDERVTDHSISHGKELALELFFRKHFKIVMSRAGVKRIRAPGALQFVEVKSDPDPLSLQVWDVSPASDSLFGEIDSYPSNLMDMLPGHAGLVVFSTAAACGCRSPQDCCNKN